LFFAEGDVGEETDPIPLPAVKGEHLDLIIKWCKHEIDNRDAREQDKKMWNQSFFEELDDATIFAIILVFISLFFSLT